MMAITREPKNKPLPLRFFAAFLQTCLKNICTPSSQLRHHGYDPAVTICLCLRVCLDVYKRQILISTHGCASRAFLRNVYEDKEDYWHGGVPMNCAVSIVDVKDGKAVLLESDKIYYDASDCVDYYAAKEEKNEDK